MTEETAIKIIELLDYVPDTGDGEQDDYMYQHLIGLLQALVESLEALDKLDLCRRNKRYMGLREKGLDEIINTHEKTIYELADSLESMVWYAKQGYAFVALNDVNELAKAEKLLEKGYQNE